MQVCPGSEGPYLLFLLLSCCLLPVRKFTSTWDLGLRDLYVLFPAYFRLIVLAPSDVEGRGIVMEHVCCCDDTWDDMAMYCSTPLGSTSW